MSASGPSGEKRPVRLALLFAVIILICPFQTRAAQASDSSDTCMACHSDKDLTAKHGKQTVSLFVDGKAFAGSVHSKLTCTGCHSDLEGKDIPHPQPAKVDCTLCHSDEGKQYEQSAHGKAVAHGDHRAPACVSCHGNHEIVPVKDPRSAVAPRKAALLCRSCHEDGASKQGKGKLAEANVYHSYIDSIHSAGLKKTGLVLGPTCISCHTAHNILPSSDPRSPIADANMVSSCSKCHAGLQNVHSKVIRAELWQNKSTIPACVTCHQPHKVGQGFSARGATDRQCLSCHNDPDLKTSDGHPAFVQVSDLSSSRHAGIACRQCHTDITASHVADGKTAARKVDCTSCHADTARHYQRSIHGQLFAKGDSNAPTCTDCHGTHHILGKRQPESLTFAAKVPELCGTCHREGQKAALRYKGNEHQIVGRYTESIHGKGLLKSGLTVTATCTSCHTPHEELPASDPDSTVNAKNLPDTCGGCHEGIQEQFSHSVHSASVTHTDKTLPVCNDCHTAHSIQRADQDGFKLEIMTKCGRCHSEIAETYFDTYHGKVSRLGYTAIAKCYDCHGAHDILKVSDPKSHLSKANVVATCAKCHAGATASFAGYLTHATHHDRKKYPIVFWTFWGMTALLVGVFFVAGVHTFMWLPRSFKLRRQIKAEELARRSNSSPDATEFGPSEKSSREEP